MPTLQLLFSFHGRINRGIYWQTTILVLVIYTGLVFVAFMIGALPSAVAAMVVLFIPLGWIGLANGAKRLHDRDKSGWWLLVLYVVPPCLRVIGHRLDTPLTYLVYLPSFAISLWAIIELGFLRGTDGPNEYGPDPLQSASRQPA
jgi:uncharacterized membrane protein YhaH (DUF805 family)